MQRPIAFTKRRWYLFAIRFAVDISIGVVIISFVFWLDRRSSQRFCDVVGTINSSYHQQPPTSPTGRKLAEDIARLYERLGC